MDEMDCLISDLVKLQVDSSLLEDSSYEMLATPLKPASAFKQAHRQQLEEFFKMKELRKQFNEAPNLILELLPRRISSVELDKVKTELGKSSENFARFILSEIEKPSEKSSDKPVLFQEIFGLSDDTLLHIYDLGVDLVKEGNYDNANTLFVFLTTLAPHVTSYWIAQGVCLQSLERHEDAIAIFNIAKFLDSSDPASLS